MYELPLEIYEEIFSYLLPTFYSTIRSLNLYFKNFADKNEENGRIIDRNRNMIIKFIKTKPEIIRFHYLDYHGDDSYIYQSKFVRINNEIYHEYYCNHINKCDCNRRTTDVNFRGIIDYIEYCLLVPVSFDVIKYYLDIHPLKLNPLFRINSINKNYNFYINYLEKELKNNYGRGSKKYTDDHLRALSLKYDKLFKEIVDS